MVDSMEGQAPSIRRTVLASTLGDHPWVLRYLRVIFDWRFQTRLDSRNLHLHPSNTEWMVCPSCQFKHRGFKSCRVCGGPLEMIEPLQGKFWELLDAMNERRIPAKEAYRRWNYITQGIHPQFQRVANWILDGKLPVPLSIQSVNKALRKMNLEPIREFPGAPHEAYDKSKKPWKDSDEWWVMRYRGEHRVIAAFDDGTLQLYSSSGQPIDGDFWELHHILCEYSGTDSLVIDGEWDGETFYVCDAVPYSGFVDSSFAGTYRERRKLIDYFCDMCGPRVKRERSWLVKSKNDVKARRKKWGGVALRNNGPFDEPVILWEQA